MDEAMIALLICPRCKAPLSWRPAAQEFLCPGERLAFAVRHGVPVMLIDEARTWAGSEEVG